MLAYPRMVFWTPSLDKAMYVDELANRRNYYFFDGVKFLFFDS